MSEWISVKDKLPDFVEIKAIRIDAWIVATESDKYRVPDAKFKEGVFYEEILTEYGDFHYNKPLSDVTHWLLPEPP